METALLKVYLINDNKTLVSALLRNQDNCLPSEVEKELKKHQRRTELVSFYEKQNRHAEALDLMSKTDSLSSRDHVLNYLSKLDNSHIDLIFEYVQPMIKAAMEESNNDDILYDILMLFVGEPGPTSPSVMDPSQARAGRLDPIRVYDFLNNINQDFAIRYLEHICLKPELGAAQRDIHNRMVYAYCDRIKQLSDQWNSMKKATPKEVYAGTCHLPCSSRPSRLSVRYISDDDVIATRTSSVDADTYSSMSPTRSSKKEYEEKLKFFLLNQNCQCDYQKLESYFVRERAASSDHDLFSLHYAIVLGKLKRHELALEIFVENGLYTDAERYCETIYSSGDIDLARQLYRKLIEHYLKKGGDGNLNDSILKPILRIVNNASERLDPVQILEILPGQLKLNSTKDFIEHSLQTCSKIKRSSQLERNLLFLKMLGTQSKRIAGENHSFMIDTDSQCARTECTQPFTASQAVVRFPNNRIVHFSCRTRYEKELEERNKKRY